MKAFPLLLPSILLFAACSPENQLFGTDEEAQSSVAAAAEKDASPSTPEASKDAESERKPDPVASEPVLIGGAFLLCLPNEADVSVDCLLKGSSGPAVPLPDSVVWKVIYADASSIVPKILVKDQGAGLYNVTFERENARSIELSVDESQTYSFAIDALSPEIDAKAIEIPTVGAKILQLSPGTQSVGDGLFSAEDTLGCPLPELFNTQKDPVPRIDFKLRVPTDTHNVRMRMRNVCALGGSDNRVVIEGPAPFIRREIRLLPNTLNMELLTVDVFFPAGEYSLSLLVGPSTDGTPDDYVFESIDISGDVGFELIP